MNIYESITAAMAEGYSIGKNSKNSQQGFMYRGIDAVMNTFQPILSKYKIFAVPTVLEERREERTTSKGSALIYTVLKIKYTFYAEDGTFVDCVVIGEGMDSGDKSANKAMSVAMKYAMFQIFCIPTEEMIDPDGESHNLAPKRKGPPPLVCEACGSVIEDYISPSGKKTSAQDVAINSLNMYGKQLCADCTLVMASGG